MFNTATEIYRIKYLDVRLAHRGYGIGKELLARSRIHAIELGAIAIDSTLIVSRESYEAMVAVFGDASLSMDEIGGFAGVETGVVPEMTRGFLYHPLSAGDAISLESSK